MKHIRFDWAAKKMLRDKANFGILEGFLSELLKDNIKIDSILESETNKETSDDKFNRVDLLVRNSKKELIIIEIQNTRELDYLFRLLFITSKAVTENIKEGSPYSAVIKVITISVLYFDLGQGNDYIYRGTTNFVGLHSNDQLQLSEGQKKLFQKQKVEQIFPEHYLIRISQFDENKISLTKDKFDEWVYFLKTSEIKDNFTAQGIDEARKKLAVMNMPNDEQKAYQQFLDKISTEASVAETLKFEAEQKVRKDEKMQIAKNLLKNKVDKQIISLTTDLTIDEIENIDNE
jgi:predicted transposase/invertase (TIGR01784 family)